MDYTQFIKRLRLPDGFTPPTRLGRRTELTEQLLDYDVDVSWWVTAAAYEKGYYAKLYDALRAWLEGEFCFWRPYYSNRQIPS